MTKFPPYVTFTVHYVSKNINSSSLGLCIGIVLDCSVYLFSIEILNLNLTFVVCRKGNSKALAIQYLKLPLSKYLEKSPEQSRRNQMNFILRPTQINQTSKYVISSSQVRIIAVNHPTEGDFSDQKVET